VIPKVLGTAALGTLATLGVLVGMRLYDARAPRRVSSITVVQATGAPAAASAGDPRIPTVPLEDLPVVSTTRGVLVFNPAAKGHRVYVDGAVAGEANGPIEVKCGPRAIRVGSQGNLQAVVVPCGGEILVGPR
jgi:hypothetical protein